MVCIFLYPTSSSSSYASFDIVPTNPSSSAAPQIAPGAENVGQAQILNTLSKPFTLEGLFGAADAGAFGGGAGGDQEMINADEDGDMFWDAEEPMDEDE